ncbi:MAG: LON peptidase substrate-binding domain-containing protein, partial [Gammaproteobacteria bacterium]|nr:LON peptidase substrate-binding domain-containing protein [Gammaproteobacteria bacterium]
MTKQQDIQLFPLRVVMFPGSKLDLQIFERRYLDMISHCLRNDMGFGVCLLREGDEMLREEGRQSFHRTGTYTRIIDWDQLENGLLGITVEGKAKFRIHNAWEADNGVLEAQAELSEQDCLGQEAIPVSEEFSGLVDLLQSLENHPLIEQKDLHVDYGNLWEVGWRLSDLVPLDMDQRQQLLEQDDPWERIRSIEKFVSLLANNR